MSICSDVLITSLIVSGFRVLNFFVVGMIAKVIREDFKKNALLVAPLFLEDL